MKVLQISNDYCSTEIYANLVRELEHSGIEQTVYAAIRNAKDIGKRKLQNSNVKYEYSHILKPIMKGLYFYKIQTVYKDLLSKINVKRFDLVHTHFLFTDGGVAYKIWKDFGVKYITTVRETDLHTYFRFFRHARRYAFNILKNAEAVIFISPVAKHKLFRILPEDLRQTVELKSFIIPNAINSFWLNNTPVTPPSIQANEPIKFLFVGELSKQKNAHKTIRFIKMLNEQGRPAELTIIGRAGDYLEEIKRLAQKNRDFVHFVGQITDRSKLLEYYRQSHIFIMPSINETFGLVYIEAMSQGLPCIYSKNHGIDGLFQDGVIGYPVNIDEMDEVLVKVNRIIDNYLKISAQCTQLARSFSIQHQLGNYLSLYSKVFN